MSRQMRVFISLFFCLLVMTSTVIGQSQLGTGAISGVVQDSNGALIAGATVTVSNSGTGLTRSVTTNDAGQFSVPVLPAGEYSVRVEQAGFAKLEQKNLVVKSPKSGKTVKINMKEGKVGK